MFLKSDNLKNRRISGAPYTSVELIHKGDPESRNDGTGKRWKNPRDPKRSYRRTVERRKIPRNPKRRNDGISPEILKDETVRRPVGYSWV